MLNAVEIKDDRLRARFERFGAAEYELFLKCKRLPEYGIEFEGPDSAADGLVWTITAPARFAPMLGVELPAGHRPGRPIAAFLYDDQVAEVEMALVAKRFAVWSDCGLGKTYVGGEFAMQVHHRTGGRVLIITRNELVPQWLEMLREPWAYGADYPIVRLGSLAELKAFCRGDLPATPIAIVNQEKFDGRGTDEEVINECRMLAGVVLDEASLLAASGGKRKWCIVKSFRGVEYKLALTATPAPNDYIEFASQASFLEHMRADNEIIWTFFNRDEKTHRWTIKPHARRAFFEWMASWSIYVSDPRVYGWRLPGPNMAGYVPPPAPEIIRHNIAMTADQHAFVMDHNAQQMRDQSARTDRSGTASMFAEEANAITAGKLSQAAKGFVYVGKGAGRVTRPIESLKPGIVADIVAGELQAGLQVLVWTEYDAETQIIEAAILSHPKLKARACRDVDVLTGDTPERERPDIVSAFRHGESGCLITRATMLGFGMNFQNCGAMVFSGWTFSFQSFYQAWRRAVRDGQTKRVRIHLPVIPELEGQMLDAIGRKDRQHEEAAREMEANYVMARQALRGAA